MPPFMHALEFSQVLAAVRATRPRRVLEWGSGGSTVALLTACPDLEALVSLEYDRAWHDRVRDAVDDPRLQLHFVAPTVPQPQPAADDPERYRITAAWTARCENEPAIMADYVALPRTVYPNYDFVLVDGRARNACLVEGYDLLAPGGTMVLHDAQRDAYHATVARFPDHLYLEPYVDGQVCIIRKPA